jgi:hypothetical protein
MLRTVIGVLAAAITATAFSALPADAAKKGKKRYPAPNTSIGISGPSLDGRVTGYPRTCWHDYYVYDTRGIPVGPYCH